MNKKQTLHFTIGENFGTLITDIAQEHLLYNNDITKAKKAIKDSLIGITDEQVIPILLGEQSLSVDVEKQELYILPIPFKKVIKINEWISNILKTQEELCKSFMPTIKKLKENRKTETYSFQFDYNYFHDYFIENDLKEVIDFIENDDKISVDKELYNILLKIVDDILKKKEFFMELVNENLATPFKLPYHIDEFLYEVDILKQKPRLSKNNSSSLLDNYMKSQRKIDEIIKKGIVPVDHIKNKWDAGWIDQEGNYYAFNGTIANMLHMQIADELVNIGIIPKDFDGEISADVWLERNGWVKQHGDHILYAGYNNHKFGSKDIPISKKQIKVITELIRHHYKGIIWPGFDPNNRMSVLSWANADPLQYRLKYFTI